MRPNRLKAVAALAAVGALVARQPAVAGGSTLDALPARGPLVDGDLLPVAPASGPALMKTTAGALRDFVLTSVKAYGAVGDGVADDTAALQAAIDSGQSLYCPPGVYKTTASLRVESPANDGQTIRGAGSWGAPDAFNATAGGGACVIRPTAAVSRAIVIDGAPFPGGGPGRSWVQGFGLESLVIDMAAMADDAGHVAINQIQAWDGRYDRVRVINDGANKRAWLFSTGAYTTQVSNSQGHVVDLEGTTGGNGVTTITLFNFDGGRIIGNYVGDVKVIGGALQGANETKVYLRNAFDVDITTDVEGSGTFLDLTTSDSLIYSRSELQGFSGTYLSGTANDLSLWDEQQNYYASPNCVWSSSYTGFSLNGCGTGSNYSQLISGSSTDDQYIMLGRLSGETVWGIAGEANWFIGGAAQGDTVLGSISNSCVWLMADQAAIAKACQSGFYTFGSGTINEGLANLNYANLGGAQIKPTTDGQTFTLENAAGGSFMVCVSSPALAASYCSVGAGADWRGYSDNSFSVPTYDMDGANGQILSYGSGGIGYGAGAGGTVTQATSRTTGVTINKITGAIALFSAAGSTAATTFTVTDSAVAASDVVEIAQKSGVNLYNALITAVAAGSFNVTVYTTGGTATDAPVFNFAVIKGATS